MAGSISGYVQIIRFQRWLEDDLGQERAENRTAAVFLVRMIHGRAQLSDEISALGEKNVSEKARR